MLSPVLLCHAGTLRVKRLKIQIFSLMFCYLGKFTLAALKDAAHYKEKRVRHCRLHDVTLAMVQIMDLKLSACTPQPGRCVTSNVPPCWHSPRSHSLPVASPVLGVVPELCQCQDLELVCDNSELQDVPTVAVNVTMMWVKHISPGFNLRQLTGRLSSGGGRGNLLPASHLSHSWLWPTDWLTVPLARHCNRSSLWVKSRLLF